MQHKLRPRRLLKDFFLVVASTLLVACSGGGEETPPIDAGPPGSCAVDADCKGMSAAHVCCGGMCVDSSSDAAHCGSCAACPAVSHASAACVAGACAVGTCDKGYADCDKAAANGCEENTDSAPEHCGACGNKCSVANGGAACEMGACIIASCNTGRADCNGKVDDGCEVDLRSDDAHCGGCMTACTSLPGTEAKCVAGACFTGTCKAGFASCDGDAKNGCEIDLGTDANNCGACGTVCPGVTNGTAGCKAGVCTVGSCGTGFADCDGLVWNGCETNTATDAANCGGCGKACSTVDGGTLKCESGACTTAVCSLGYADCDTTASNGCEVALAADAKNCGICGNVCPAITNATAACSGFVCGLGACNAGYADCFGGIADGCETSLMDDPDHCGGCPNACALVANGTRACTAGACAIGSCNTGYKDCDGTLSNGCESKSAEDPANCGACGNACSKPTNGAAACSGGTCGLGACETGWANCNGNDADGCERDVTTDADNCGGCGVKCGSGSCVAAKCVCSKNVLLLRDDSTTGAATLAAALTAAGYTVTTSSVPSYQYNGTNPALTGFGAVLVLAGGPTAPSWTTDMPSAGQTALVNFVAAGNGIVFTEWAAHQVASGRWTTLAPLVLLTRSSTFGGNVNVTVDPARASHPIWAGLPSTFAFSANVNVGTAKSGSNISVLGTSPEAFDALVIRDAPVGRLVHFASAGNYAPNGWSNTNVQKLIANATGWVARCN